MPHIRIRKGEAYRREVRLNSLRSLNKQIAQYLNLDPSEPCYLLADLNEASTYTAEQLEHTASVIVGNFLPLKEVIRTNRHTVFA